MLVFGRNTVLEGLRSTYTSEKLYLQEAINRDEKITNIINLAESNGVEIEYIPRHTLSKILKTEDHQGCGLKIDFDITQFKGNFLDNITKSFIFISEVTYEHNIGAIIRTAECAGFGGVLVPNNTEITSTAIKASTGAIFHIPVFKASLFPAIKEFKKNAFDIAAIERGGTNLYNTQLDNSTLFIIGGEDKSVSDTIKKECNKILEIPQFGKINSLNMSVATAVVVYEHIRQLNFK